ncbi:PQQ-dependent sugar dehydrogenase [Sphingomonas sp. BGYR3]|uniref:PQQ-dependent sugar dehydrogenase n=1 Tax=Sphingomonas sp. BGYR3 TaxID=2975483 RepID=UPI0021A39362|nr:PQQ-dependent sugar dehydrogenase [Sphingomonas sp. BGYR3]MDG5489380.1 PQQ-dependent sugar dehydrogenase [Sphingomonas sp. BGYR3]
MRFMMKFQASIIALAFAAAACGQAGDAAAQNSPTTGKAADAFTIAEVADFTAPWAMTFLPDGRALVTEKAGELVLLSADGKTKTVVATIPGVDAEGQGGLMDVVLHPQFASNGMVYLSYSTAGNGGKGVVLARGKMVDGPAPRLDGLTTIFTAAPFVEGAGHYSGRIAFAPDGHLFFTNGERQKFDPAQDPKATLGKVLRLKDDGTPAGDPGLTAKGFHPAVWSYGHRNLLGIAFDGAGNLWEQEMGPKGGDEVNLVLPGRNYGYPIVSDGDHYDGKDIPDHSTRPEFEKPKVSWNPVISPGGLIVYSGTMFPDYRGDIFIGGLSSQSLVHVKVTGTDAAKADQWDMGARIREVEQGPKGELFVLEDGGRGSQGRLLKLTPKG